MKENPFKFGTIVDGVHFTDREDGLHIYHLTSGVNTI